MDALIYTVMSGAERALHAQQVHANNLANLDTPGFRADLELAASQAVNGYGYDTRHLSELKANAVSTREGTVKSTGRELDVAVQGPGYLAVEDGTGEAYTRAGTLQVDADGALTVNGRPVLGEGGPIVLPPYTRLEIGSDGSISVQPAGETEMQTVDQLKLVKADGKDLTKNAAGLLVTRRPAAGRRRQRARAQRLPGGQQRRRGRGDGRHDDDQPRLRDADEALPGRRHDDPDRQPPDPRRVNRLPLFRTENPMNPALWISKTGVQAQDAKLQTIANNLANVNTVGFKRDRVMFEDLFYQVESQPGAQQADGTQAPTGVQLGTGTRVVGTQKVFTTGNLQTTGQSLDVAIVGNGFLQVALPNGDTAYTRAGQLQVNSDGKLVNAQGLAIQPEITIPANATGVTISESGLVTATVAGATAPTELGQLQLAGFINPAGLLARARTCSRRPWPAARPPPATPAATRWASSSRARWKAPTCRWSRRWWT
jgi:flagellar basal-body rod protein FlgG